MTRPNAHLTLYYHTIEIQPSTSYNELIIEDYLNKVFFLNYNKSNISGKQNGF